jgi:hypothetical protein
VEQDVDGIHLKKLSRKWGSRGLAPLGCFPLWGREGVTLKNFKRVIRMISTEPKNGLFLFVHA